MRDDGVQTELLTKKIEDIKKAFNPEDGGKYIVRVGILGNQSERMDSTLTNAQVGLIHEVGVPTSNIPKRSFLEMPIRERLAQIIQNVAVIDDKSVNEIVQDKTNKNICEKIGALAVGAVLEAFDTGGFGKWKALQDATVTAKQAKGQGDQILVASTQLRNSISFDVVKK